MTETITFHFECPESTWRAWANTVPREKSLESALVELIDDETP